ncbi:prefoldin subunit 5 [Paraburkholderia sp. CI3]
MGSANLAARTLLRASTGTVKVHLQILEVILWPKAAGQTPRRVPFEAGKVNVISGTSKRGKSSVVPIVDYCLGSRLCSIPAGKIRQACAWFGIRVQTSEGEKIFARREPGNQQSTDDMMLLEDVTLDVPIDTPAKNTTRQAVKRLLDRLAGLSNLSFDAEETGSGFQGRPSFRDTLAFCFQPQNIVANPDVLYFRADTNEHREKVRTIFPYVLGATTPERLEKKWILENLVREFRRKDRERSAYAKVSATWLANLQVWVTEARELGLLQGEAPQATEEALIAALETVLTADNQVAGFSAQGVSESADEYTALQAEESKISLELSVARHRRDQITVVRSTVGSYKSALKDQTDRLGIARWLRTHSDDGERCPICDGAMTASSGELEQLCDALTTIEDETHTVSMAPPVLDRDLVELTSQMALLEDQLKAVRVRKRAIESRSKTIREAEQASTRVARFLGRVEQALELFSARYAPGGLNEELEKLTESIGQLRRELAEQQYQVQLDAATTQVSEYITRIAATLDVERKSAPARIDIKELTVGVRDDAGREDYLWHLGSGANWLSYHVAAILALHSFFLRQAHSPVPALIIFDQPSQVYFPQQPKRAAREIDEELADEDVASIRRFYEAMGKLTAHFKGKLQIIVLDHAGPNVWGELNDVTLAEEWRGDEYLVPKDWLSIAD